MRTRTASPSASTSCSGASATPPGRFQHEERRLEALDPEIVTQAARDAGRLGEEKRQEHKLAILFATEEQPSQWQVAIRALQDAVDSASSRAVKLPFKPTAPPRVVGED